MCGIFALFGEDVDVSSYLLSHRGPDSYGTKTLGKCRMDFYRLLLARVHRPRPRARQQRPERARRQHSVHRASSQSILAVTHRAVVEVNRILIARQPRERRAIVRRERPALNGNQILSHDSTGIRY